MAEAIEGLRTMAGQRKVAISKAVDSKSFRKLADDLDPSPKVGKEGSSGWYAVCANWKAMMLKIRMLANPTSAIPLTGEIVYMSDRAPKNPQDKVDNEPSTETGITLALSKNKMAAASKYDSHSHVPQGSSSLTI